MRYFILIAICALLIAGGLDAQKGYGGGNKGKTYKKANEKANKQGAAAAKKAKNNAEQAEKEEAREEAKEEREEAKSGESQGAAEDAAEDAADEPGTTVSREIKDETLDEVMDELGLEDKSMRSKFKSNVRKAWEDSEAEDKRYAIVYKRYLENTEQLESEKRVHAEKLKKIWDASDEKLVKDKVLDGKQMETWKADSEDLRTKTSTDYYYESKAEAAAKAAKKQKKEAEPPAESPSEEEKD